jgi:hypothetical protein
MNYSIIGFAYLITVCLLIILHRKDGCIYGLRLCHIIGFFHNYFRCPDVASLNYASLENMGWWVPVKMRPQDDAFLGRFVPGYFVTICPFFGTDHPSTFWNHPRDASSQGRIIPGTHHPRDASSKGRIIQGRIVQGRKVRASFLDDVFYSTANLFPSLYCIFSLYFSLQVWKCSIYSSWHYLKETVS